MTQGRSSSNRVASISDAVLWKDHRALGPMRLPENRADDFVADFNRIYRGIGIVLSVVDPIVVDMSKKIPGNTNVAGDSILDD